MIHALIMPLLLLVPQQDSTQKLVADLFGKNSRACFKAYLALQRAKSSDALPLLLSGVHSAPLRAQDYALTVIQGYPIDTRRKALRKLLKSESPFVAFGAGAQLYKLGDKALWKGVLRSLDAGSADSAILRQMVQRVTYSTIPELHPRFSALINQRLDASTLDQILYCLARSAFRPALVEVETLLTSKSVPRDQRMICAAFAQALGDGGAEVILIEGLRTADSATKRRLQKFLSIAPELSDSLLAAIGESLKSSESGYQLAPWLSLLAKHGKPSVAKWIQPMVEHKDAVAAKAAVKALVDLHKIDAAALRRLLNASRHELVLVAADTLRRMDDPSGLPQVLKVARSSHNRYETVKVLSGFRSKEVVPVLIGFLDDPNQTVRSRASTGLLASLNTLYPFRRFDLSTAGYQVAGSALGRKEAITKIRAWWQSNQ